MIAAELRGLLGLVFVDYLDGYTYLNTPGKPFRAVSIQNVSRDSKGTVTLVEPLQYGADRITEGASVTFLGVEGMIELNGREFKVQNLTNNSFDIGPTLSFSPYKQGGYANRVYTHPSSPIR